MTLDKLRSLLGTLYDERMAESEQLALMRSFVKDRQMAEVADYIKRGRCYANCNDTVVCLGWAQAFKELPTSQIEGDLAAELQLRGIDPPLHLVEAELRAIAKSFTSALERGDLDEEAADAFLAELADFRMRLAQKHH